jgi:hypothetical protein
MLFYLIWLVFPPEQPINAVPGWCDRLTELHMGGGPLDHAELSLGDALPHLQKWVIRNGTFGFVNVVGPHQKNTTCTLPHGPLLDSDNTVS